MFTDPGPASPADLALDELIKESIATAAEQRHYRRFPRFRPRSIVVDNIEDQERIQEGIVDVVTPLDEIATAIVRLVGQGAAA
jgi:hypothetical protein